MRYILTASVEHIPFYWSAGLCWVSDRQDAQQFYTPEGADVTAVILERNPAMRDRAASGRFLYRSPITVQEIR